MTYAIQYTRSLFFPYPDVSHDGSFGLLFCSLVSLNKSIHIWLFMFGADGFAGPLLDGGLKSEVRCNSRSRIHYSGKHQSFFDIILIVSETRPKFSNEILITLGACLGLVCKKMDVLQLKEKKN